MSLKLRLFSNNWLLLVLQRVTLKRKRQRTLLLGKIHCKLWRSLNDWGFQGRLRTSFLQMARARIRLSSTFGSTAWPYLTKRETWGAKKSLRSIEIKNWMKVKKYQKMAFRCLKRDLVLSRYQRRWKRNRSRLCKFCKISKINEANNITPLVNSLFRENDLYQIMWGTFAFTFFVLKLKLYFNPLFLLYSDF